MKTKRYTKVLMLSLSSGRFLMILTLSLLWLAVAAVPILAADIIVDDTGTDDITCGTDSAPCRTIAYALTDRAMSGDVVIVRDGTYTETITMEAGVVISGTEASTTIIDGEGLRGPMVTAGSGVTASAILKGFTIRGGVADYGGGIYIAGTASPVITNVAVISNTAVRGGGLYIASTASPRIEDLKVSDNYASGRDYADGGGGMYVAGSLILTNTCMVSNTAVLSGGGLFQFAESGGVTLIRGCFEQNVAQGMIGSNGGGAFIRGSLSLTGTSVVSNTALRAGGGLYVGHTTVLTNAEVIGNTAGQWGGGLHQNSSGYLVQISGARFAYNTVTGSSESYGGGINAFSGAEITNTDFISNTAVVRGGGVHISNPSTLINIRVISNTAESGGGVYFNSTSILNIRGGRFEQNSALIADGGALYSYADISLTDTLILDNAAARWGGGLYVGGTATLHNTQVVSNTTSEHGGGLYQYTSNGRVDVVSGSFVSNTATASGGGLYVGGTAALTETEVLTNSCGVLGGGLYIVNDVLLQDVVVSANTAEQSGGGLYQSASAGKVSIVGGRFDDNVAIAPPPYRAGGGGLSILGSTVITGTEVISNASGGRGGGGLYAQNGARITNALFADNSATASPYDGAGIYLRGEDGSQELVHLTVVSSTVGNGSAIYVFSGTVGVTNTIVASYTVGLERFDGVVDEDYNLYFGNGTAIQGTVQSGGHSLSGLDPLFLDPTTDDYHIGGESAALDAGSFDPGVTTDIDDDPRPMNTVQPDMPDIGCDENRSTTIRRTITDTLTFGAVCARQVYTDTGSLTAVTTSIAYVYPPNLSEAIPLQRTYTITTAGAGPVSATLTLCYTDDEVVAENVDESTLNLYRYDGANWQVYTSTVDTSDNTVTAYGIDTFSPWALAGDSPTAAHLQSFMANPTPLGVTLEWETALEIDMLGFNLYRTDSSGFSELQLNDSLIPSAVPGSTIGASYQWMDNSAKPGVEYSYWLEDVDVRGVTTRHGPASAMLTVRPYITYLPIVLR